MLVITALLFSNSITEVVHYITLWIF